MTLEADVEGAVDLCENWSVGSISVKDFFPKDLEEARILKTVHVSGEEITSDILTKNSPQAVLKKARLSILWQRQHHKKFMCGQKLKNEAATIEDLGLID